MHWKWKARIQNAVSLLPSSASYAMYYWLQRNFGGLRRITPVKRFTAGIETWKRILKAGKDPVDRVFFEIGTGRVPNVPIAFWLMGANSTITVDLNPYMKLELTSEVLQYVSSHRSEIEHLFGGLLQSSRLQQLIEFQSRPNYSLTDVLSLCKIQYIAPGDASQTALPDKSIDFHTSYTVFEHIPRPILEKILAEGNRLIRSDGMFVHGIDYSDHFAHSDKSISAINFLQYDDAAWNKYADNRYMYMNRLRHDDFLDIFQSAGHRIVGNDPTVDPKLRELLRSGKLPLADRFKNRTEEVLATTDSWIVTEKVS